MTPSAWLELSVCMSLATMQAADKTSSGEYKKTPGPHSVADVLYTWHDDSRNRDVPVKVYYPKDEAGPFPVIIFSHGLGGTRETYAYLGQHWASHGYVCVHVQHIGSDDSVWRGQLQPLEAMKRSLRDPQHALNRPLDVRFVLEQLEKTQREPGVLKGRLDLARVGIGGHSFGAFTSMAVAGQTFVTLAGKPVTAGDWHGKFKAAIVMSPNAPTRRDDLDTAYAQIRIPTLHMTGTRDDSPVGDTKAADRRIPFDHITSAETYLVIFEGGDHMVFSGRRRLRGGDGGRDARFQDLIRMSTTAFWDAELKGDAAAKRWLADGDFKQELGQDGTFEQKSATRPAP